MPRLAVSLSTSLASLTTKLGQMASDNFKAIFFYKKRESPPFLALNVRYCVLGVLYAEDGEIGYR